MSIPYICTYKGEIYHNSIIIYVNSFSDTNNYHVYQLAIRMQIVDNIYLKKSASYGIFNEWFSNFLKILFIYLFIFGYVGSSLLNVGFL